MRRLYTRSARHFTKLKDVKEVDTGLYCIPFSPSFAALDALKQPDMLFQMTVHQKRGVHTAGLLRALNALRRTPGQPLRFRLVVPSAVGPSSGRLFDDYRPVPHMQGVEQWVLEVPVVVHAQQ